MKKIWFIIRMLAAPLSIFGQTVDNTLIVSTESGTIQVEARAKLPLLELPKVWGLELNVPGLAGGAVYSKVFISGSLSFFNIDERAEIVFPVLIYKPTTNRTQLMRVDAVYRRFISNRQEGLYVAAGIRYANVVGRQESTMSGGRWLSSHKTGLLAGVGYRLFHKRFYWGAGLSAGTYLTGNKNLRGLGFDGGRQIVDVEFLKFGVVF